MDSLLFILVVGIATGISGAMIPGPLTLFTVAEALKNNKFAGFKIILGHVLVEFVLLLFIFLGFHKLLTIKSFLLVVYIGGGLALITMGILLLLTAGKMKLSEIKTNANIDKGLVAGGIFFSMISPGFFVWWVTIGLSTVISAAVYGIIGVLILMLGHWLADILWYGLLAYAVDKGKMFLSDKTYQWVIKFFSVLLVWLGLTFLILKR